ncbi:MAG TPA: DUF364 domain-containing protein [Thermoflexia bacterium]|nr:DUF364 domain-containing protein [Thermoflexia bacterium]
MAIIDDLLVEVTGAAAEARLVDICIGAYWSVVGVEVGGQLQAGISSTLHGGDNDQHHGGQLPVRASGHLHEQTVTELLALMRSDSLLEASVGIATLNALLEVHPEECVEINAADVLVEQGRGRRVAIVGHFPFVRRVQQAAAECWVLELDPHGVDLPASRSPEILPQADVIALTGTSLLNHTFDELIALCRPEAYVVLLGGTTPLSPVFFRYGVDAVAGTRIVDAGAALTAISQGATFKQIGGKLLLTLFRNK